MSMLLVGKLFFLTAFARACGWFFGTNKSICWCLRVTWLFKQLSYLKHRWAVAAFDLTALFVLVGWNRGSLGRRCSWELKGERTRRYQHATGKLILPARVEKTRKEDDREKTAGPFFKSGGRNAYTHVWPVGTWALTYIYSQHHFNFSDQKETFGFNKCLKHYGDRTNPSTRSTLFRHCFPCGDIQVPEAETYSNLKQV